MKFYLGAPENVDHFALFQTYSISYFKTESLFHVHMKKKKT